MSLPRTAATREEETELKYLRDQADRTAAEAALILAELTRRVDAARRPADAVRRFTADARVTALRALREGPGAIAGQRGAKRLVLAAVPVILAAAALAYVAARGPLTPDKLKVNSPERLRLPARRSIPLHLPRKR